ncbi:MAG: tetraacyldisaccharide 4'-kinase [Puniceicoccales bacterium]|jgi:tetraacyldisaccharide 4'-kinase|nr:tetraacyldisaccharide 4'-kinase [Puniceicoccales bacterium]
MSASLNGRIKKYWEDFERFLTDVIYNRRKGKKILFWGGILFLLSQIFRMVVKGRLAAYRRCWMSSHHLGCRVVVVGNLTVGGTGKTPVVEKIARALDEQGRRVAILSRGYKSRSESWRKRLWRWLTHAEPPPPKVVSDGTHIYLNSEEAGDEPYLLARNLKNVSVLVDKDRVKAGNYAVRRLGADILVLDDGFQYLQLKASHYLTLVDATNPFGNGCLLPRGILREPLEHLGRSSYIFLTKADVVDRDSLENLKQQIRCYHPLVEFIECRHTPLYLQDVFDENRKMTFEDLRNLQVATLSGIAMPEGFENFLLGHGVVMVYRERHADHYRFTAADLHQFYRRSEQSRAQGLVTTEKDAVRISSSFPRPSLPFYFLRMEIQITGGLDLFHKVISELACRHFSEDRRVVLQT